MIVDLLGGVEWGASGRGICVDVQVTIRGHSCAGVVDVRLISCVHLLCHSQN